MVLDLFMYLHVHVHVHNEKASELGIFLEN